MALLRERRKLTPADAKRRPVDQVVRAMRIPARDLGSASRSWHTEIMVGAEQRDALDEMAPQIERFRRALHAIVATAGEGGTNRATRRRRKNSSLR